MPEEEGSFEKWLNEPVDPSHWEDLGTTADGFKLSEPEGSVRPWAKQVFIDWYFRATVADHWCPTFLWWKDGEMVSYRPSLSWKYHSGRGSEVWEALYGPGGPYFRLCDCGDPDCTGGLVVVD